MIASEDMTPCPFCGEPAIIVTLQLVQTEKFHPRCSVCDCALGWYDTGEEAEAAWETRAIDKEKE